MRIFEDLQQWVAFRKTLDPAQTLGFAPTMGNLHKGHASLFLASKKENDLTLSSLFINPTQFNSSADFIHYPKTLDEDLKLMAASGVDFCILPQQQDIYPDAYSYQVNENQYSLLLEGQHRPGHFQGVLTVVMKLLNLMRPHRIYMGEKDFQQFKLIKSMVCAFFLEVEVKMCPTIREASGLAFSSRNNRLNPEQKKQAQTFAKIFHQKNLSCAQIIDELEALGIKIDYIEELEGRRFAAVLIGEIRLIDNYAIGAE